MKKNKVIQSIAMGILSFSLLSNNFMAFANDDIPQQEENYEEEEDYEDEDLEEEDYEDEEEDENLDDEENDENEEDEDLDEEDQDENLDNEEEDDIDDEDLEEDDEDEDLDDEEKDDEEIIEYYEEIINIPTEEEKDQIVEEETEKQEEMKQDIIDQGGTYDYAITVETITLEKEVSEEVDSKEKAEELADEVDGTIETEVVNSTEGSTTTIVETEEEVEDVVEEIAAAAPDNIEREITNVETEEVSGVSAEQVDEKGYHIDENDDGSFTIVVTGGLDEIEIDFAWFSSIQLMQPGDEINASFTIVNESGDKYEVTGYEKKTDGPYRYSTTASFNEEWGTPVTTFTDNRGREYTAYIPNEILKVNGRNIDRGTLEIMYKKYADKTMRERREIGANLTEDDMRDYYNEQMDSDYESAFEAWYANLNERLWTTTYTKDGEEETYGEDFWTSVDLTTDTPVDFTMKASLDGLGTDNLYQMTVWEFVELLKLKAVPNIKVTVDYIDNELKYTVNYTVEETNYTVIVDGNGSIPKKIEEDPIPEPPIPIKPDKPAIDPTPIPKPEPEPTPTPIVEPEKPTPEEPVVPKPDPIEEPVQPEVPEPRPPKPDIPSIVIDDKEDEPSEPTVIEEEMVPLVYKIEPTPIEEVTLPIPPASKIVKAARMAETGDNSISRKRDFLILGCISIIIFLYVVDLIDRMRKP